MLPVLHAGRDFGEEHVPLFEVRVAALHLSKRPQARTDDFTGILVDSRHRNEGRGLVVTSDDGLTWFWIYRGYFLEARPPPTVGQPLLRLDRLSNRHSANILVFVSTSSSA